MTATRNRKPAAAPRDRLRAIVGPFALHSIGCYERLAGVDTCNQAERSSLWGRFRHLYAASMKGDHQPLFDAVADHCAEIALQRLARGELCLLTH